MKKLLSLALCSFLLGNAYAQTLTPVSTQQVTIQEGTDDYIGMLGRGGYTTGGWVSSALPDAYTLTYFKRDFAIGGWRKSDGLWIGPTFFINGENGNILIGKITQANTTYKLDVAGKVRADKLIVNTNGADFVFDSAYSLLPLPELGKFVKEHRHLPGITPAKQMQQEGLDVGDNQTKLLQKIEELTLYLLDLNKKMDAQQEIIAAQAKQLDELKIRQLKK